MAKIHIKRLKNPIEVDKKIAEQISLARWGNPKDGVKPHHPDSPLKVKNYEGSLGDVVSIDHRSESQRSANMEHYHNTVDRKYLEYRKSKLQLSPAQRAEDLRFFNLVWQAFTGDIIPPGEMSVPAIDIQLKFFKENPNRIYCDPHLFQEILPASDRAIGVAIRLIENIIKQDIYHSKS